MIHQEADILAPLDPVQRRQEAPAQAHPGLEHQVQDQIQVVTDREHPVLDQEHPAAVRVQETAMTR